MTSINSALDAIYAALERNHLSGGGERKPQASKPMMAAEPDANRLSAQEHADAGRRDRHAQNFSGVFARPAEGAPASGAGKDAGSAGNSRKIIPLTFGRARIIVTDGISVSDSW